MKITRIKIPSSLHYKKGLEIDLTYPKGHKHAGEPLKKVCILGQSGTGKTSLLNLIKYMVCEDLPFNRSGIDDTAFVQDGVEMNYRVGANVCSKVVAGDR